MPPPTDVTQLLLAYTDGGPMPVVKLRRAIKGMEVGQILEMIATDPGVVPDMQAWENQTRHEVLLTENQGEGKFRFLIKKTH